MGICRNSFLCFDRGIFESWKKGIFSRSFLLILALSGDFAGADPTSFEEFKTQVPALEEATLFSLGSKSKTPVFSFRAWESMEAGVKLRRTSFVDVQGRVQVQEKIRKSDLDLESYELLDFKKNQRLWVERKILKGRAFYVSQFGKFEEFRKRPPRAEEFEIRDGLILPPAMTDLFLREWAPLESGKVVKFRLLIGELGQTISFKASAVPSSESTSPEASMSEASRSGDRLRVKVSLANPVIAIFGPPDLFFEFDRKKRKLLLYEGQTLLTDEKGKAFFSRTEFS